MPKEKTAEPKIKFAETGLVELDIKVPGLVPENAKPIMRDIRRTLENCGSLSLLYEFTVTLRVEYIEIPVERINNRRKEKIVNNLVPHNSDIPEDNEWAKRWGTIYIDEGAE